MEIAMELGIWICACALQLESRLADWQRVHTRSICILAHQQTACVRQTACSPVARGT